MRSPSGTRCTGRHTPHEQESQPPSHRSPYRGRPVGASLRKRSGGTLDDMSLRPLDTSGDALSVQRSAFEGLEPEGRVRAALEMSDAIRSVHLAGIRARHPEATEREAIAHFIAQVYSVGSGLTE